MIVKDALARDLVSAKITHKGDGDFAVCAYGDTSDLLVNEIGSYCGEVVIPSGTLRLTVTADGTWTVTKTG